MRIKTFATYAQPNTVGTPVRFGLCLYCFCLISSAHCAVYNARCLLQSRRTEVRHALWIGAWAVGAKSHVPRLNRIEFLQVFFYEWMGRRQRWCFDIECDGRPEREPRTPSTAFIYVCAKEYDACVEWSFQLRTIRRLTESSPSLVSISGIEFYYVSTAMVNSITKWLLKPIEILDFWNNIIYCVAWTFCGLLYK